MKFALTTYRPRDDTQGNGFFGISSLHVHIGTLIMKKGKVRPRKKKLTIAFIAVISAFDTKTRLAGHFPLY